MAPPARGRLRVVNADQYMAEGHAKFAMHATVLCRGNGGSGATANAFFLNAFPGCGI
jgi:hypothetical protein